MRMKEDHMRNAQLKPSYNVQLGVEGEYITGILVSSERSDQLTHITFHGEHEQTTGKAIKPDRLQRFEQTDGSVVSTDRKTAIAVRDREERFHIFKENSNEIR